MLKQGLEFHFDISGYLFEKSEVEITRVDCTYVHPSVHPSVHSSVHPK